MTQVSRLILTALLSATVWTCTAFGQGEDVLTSVSQVTDVKASDVFFRDLQNLIERYGLTGVTVGGKLDPTSYVDPIHMQRLSRKASNVVFDLAAASGIPARILEGKIKKGCTIAPGTSLALTEREAADHLKCAFGYADIELLQPKPIPLTRGLLITYTNGALSAAEGHLMAAIPTEALLKKDVFTNVDGLMAAGKFREALATIAKVEAKTYDYGDAGMQAKVAKSPVIGVKKAAVLVRLKRFAEAEALYLAAFDAYTENAGAEIARLKAFKAKPSLTNPERSLSRAAANACRNLDHPGKVGYIFSKVCVPFGQ